MSAIRLARGFTKKELIIKFSGNYHGHGDSFLIKAGSGAFTLGLPDSPGVTKNTAKDTLTAEFNDLGSVEELFESNKNNIAALIIEPIAGNMGLVQPDKGFLQGLRKICDRNNSILIFDEVMTGFRVSRGGAQELYNVLPDITTLGKIIGGGLPVGAYGGKKEIMNMLAPEGPIYQAGTLSGNPIAMAAGLKTLEIISRDGFYTDLESKTERMVKGMLLAANDNGVPMTSNKVGAMFGLFFSSEETITNFAQVKQCDIDSFNRFFHGMLLEGVNLAPSAYEAGFVSSAHTDQDIDDTIAAARKVFVSL